MILKFVLVWFAVLGWNATALAEELRDVKPPIAESAGWIWVVEIFLVILAVLFTKKYLLGHKHAEMVLTPRERALKGLSTLGPALQSDAKLDLYYSQISGIVRQFVEEFYTIHAPEMTTEEFLNSAKTAEKLPDAARSMLREFLTSCDLVKFAKYQPRSSEIAKSFTLAKSFIEQSQ